jgi:hypothetical protein
LWFTVRFSEKCWMWQNEHGLSDMATRDRCLSVWGTSSIAMVALQLVCLSCAAFPQRSRLPGWWRGIMAACALLMLAMNTWLKIVLFAPRIH